MPLSNIGLPELLFIALIVLLLFGAKRLPEIGSSFGKGIREFKRSISDVDKQLKEPERDYAQSDRIAPGAPVQRQDEEPRPEPKRLLN